MNHRHLNHDKLTLAAIDSLIERGAVEDWLRLGRAIRQSEEVRENVRRLCDGRLRLNNPEFFAIDDFRYWRRFVDGFENDTAIEIAYRKAAGLADLSSSSSDGCGFK